MKKKFLAITIFLLILFVPSNSKALNNYNLALNVIPLRSVNNNLIDGGGTNSNVNEESDITKLEFCQDTAPIFQFVGKIILIVKVVVPLVIIILGMVDFAKAVTSSDDKAIKLASASVVKRLIMGVAIFFVPTLVSLLFSLIKDAAPFLESAEECQVCILRPNSGECRGYVAIAKKSLKQGD